MRGARVVAIVLGGLGLGANGCQLVVDSKPGAGIGASCSDDAQCQASKCVEGICTISCSAAADCPATTMCAAGTCQLPLHAAFIHAGDPAQNQWAKAHEAGREFAQDHLAYLSTEIVIDQQTPADAVGQVDALVAHGAKVVVNDEPTYGEELQQKSEQYPDVMFMTCGSRVSNDNHIRYYGRAYQAYYLAGFAAGSMTTSNRIGIVGSYVTPDVVAAINAFAVGAKRAKSAADVKVEVRWVGFWHDQDPPNLQGESKEVVATDLLIASGCDIVADTTDANILVTHVKSVGGALAIGYNTFDACKDAASCLGAVTWNWGPLYRAALSDVHQVGLLDNGMYEDGIALDPAASVVNFELNAPKAAPDSMRPALDDVLQALIDSEGGRLPFQGPLCSTGQRDPGCIEDGVTIDDDEVRDMCWFVDSLWEKADPADPTSADKPATVPEKGDCVPASN